MRFFLIPVLASATFSMACGDDDTQADTVGDTIVDTSDGVDTSPDATSPTDATTATETTDDTSVATDTTVTTDATDTNQPDVEPTVGVVINEISVAGTDPDWIELYNGGSSAADIGGYVLRDDDPTHSFVIPAGTIIPGGAYLAIDEGDGVTGFDFGFGDQDGAFLFDRDDTLVDQTVWVPGEAPVGATWGRFPNGSGNFGTLFIPTKGMANVENPPAECGNDEIEVGELCDGTDLPDGADCTDRGYGGGVLGCASCTSFVYTACTPHAAALVINEVTSSGDDRIELFNGTGADIQLGGYQVKDAADNTYTFPTRIIAAGGYVVLTRGVEFDFGLGGDDLVVLLNTGGTEVDRADWLDGEADDASFCRKPNGTGGFEPCATASFGASND